MTKTYRMKIPVGIERSHGVFVMRISNQIHNIGINLLTPPSAIRQDARDLKDSDVSVAALSSALASFGLSMQTILNEDLLRRSLRRIAEMTERNVKAQLAAALGRAINTDVSGPIDDWVEDQLFRIKKLLERWQRRTAALAEEALAEEEAQRPLVPPPGLLPTGVAAGIGAAIGQRAAGVPGAVAGGLAGAEGFKALTRSLAGEKAQAGSAAFFGAATGLLMLNSALTAAAATDVGGDDYIWRTQLDDLVRDWHADLEGTVQKFSDPPSGGGTGPDDSGNPQSGFNCRCEAEIIVS